MKAVRWLGTSKRDLLGLPSSLRSEVGLDLRLVQSGLEPRDWKPMPGIGAGVREIRNRTRDGAFRTIYVVESVSTVYVLHVFQKKSQKTSPKDIDMARARYRLIP